MELLIRSYLTMAMDCWDFLLHAIIGTVGRDEMLAKDKAGRLIIKGPSPTKFLTTVLDGLWLSSSLAMLEGTPGLVLELLLTLMAPPTL